MQVLGIHHVAINVDDLPAALEFYVDRLGFDQLDRPDFGFPGAWLQAGPQQIHLLELPDQPRSASQHWAFEVENLDATLAELDADGIDYRRSPYRAGAGQQAVLSDPSGNRIELNQPDRRDPPVT